MLLDKVPVCEPFPWGHLLAYLRVRATPQAESVETDRYVRRIGRRSVQVSYQRRERCLLVETQGRVSRHDVLQRVGALFDVAHDAQPVAQQLQASAVLAPRLRAVPGMRPLGAWSPFELCVRTILGQQVSVAAACTLMRRLVERCGEIEPERLVAADLANFGMPGKRVAALQAFARACVEGSVRFTAQWPQLDARLRELPGFGPWTRGYLAIRLGRQTDAFPETDLGLIRAAGVASSTALLALARQWQPYRAYAATYLWAIDAEQSVAAPP